MRGMMQDQLREVSRLQARLRKLLDGTFPTARPAPEGSPWAPRGDIHRGPDGITVALEICGVEREDIDVTIHANTLTVSGRRSRPAQEQTEEFLEAQRPAGKFARSFTLDYEPEAIKATLEDGVLTVTLNR